MLAKFISENRIERYKGLVEFDGIVYTNDEEKAREQGYKPLITDEVPEETEGFCAVSYYEETEDAVYLRFRQEALNAEEAV
ncbi:MAG: hypothetical protein IJC86_04485 [Clostridia bacterium]|nr:hypothetical protein [Clostridia bacterium]